MTHSIKTQGYGEQSRIMIKNNKKLNSGYTIIELLFYISLFAILSTLVIDSMIVMSKSFKETSIQNKLIGGGVVMERIVREIRQASSISSISPTSIRLNTTDLSRVNKTVEFILSGSNINFIENNISIGNLNGASLNISNLSFIQITTAKGRAIKISFSVTSTHDTLSRSYYFYDTVNLRGQY